MQQFQDRTFDALYDRDSARYYADMEFLRCRFLSCGFSITRDPRLRSTVRNVQFRDCFVAASAVDCAIIEEVEVDGLQTGASGEFLFQLFGAVLKHVTLRGKIGVIMFAPHALPLEGDTPAQLAFDRANAEYYTRVDWALDIRAAEFIECDLRSVPARLVRRDPETQFVVKRQKALEGKWRDLDLSKTYWRGALELFLRRDSEDVVLVAPKQSPRFRDLLSGLQRLRRAGVAEPD